MSQLELLVLKVADQQGPQVAGPSGSNWTPRMGSTRRTSRGWNAHSPATAGTKSKRTRRSATPDWAIRSRHCSRHVGPASLCTKYGHDGVRFGSVQESLYVTKASNSRDLTWSGARSKSTTSLPEASEESGFSHHSRLLSTLSLIAKSAARDAG